MKEQLEVKVNVKFHTSDTVVPWIGRRAAMMVSPFLVGKDGRTAYECTGLKVHDARRGVRRNKYGAAKLETGRGGKANFALNGEKECGSGMRAHE